MPGVSGDNLSDFNKGDPLSAKKFQALVTALRRSTMAPGSFQTGAFNVQRPLGTPGDTTTTDSTDIKIVLIDKDIDPIKEAKPSKLLESADIEDTLTEDEIAAGYTVAFQNPVPDDDNYDDNHVDNLNLSGFKQATPKFKYFASDGEALTGTADSGDTNSIVLADGASTVDGFYDEETITITGGTGDGQTRTIGTYDGDTLTATVDEDWDTAPDNTSEYEITSTNNVKLAYTVIDDPDHMDGDTPAPRKIVRLSTISPECNDPQGIQVGEYSRGDFQDDPNYEEDGDWPPPSVDDPDTFLKRKLLGIVINNILIKEFCTPLKPPPLPDPEA